MRFLKILPFLLLVQCLSAQETTDSYPKALVNYQTFKDLVSKVESHRVKRLVSFDDFLKISKKRNTIIQDTRSAYFYNKRHIKGAINLPFTEFTQQRLSEVMPNENTKILIYCNNNFKDDRINFASKIVIPASLKKVKTSKKNKPLTLALNIPTYLNLYGYGYTSVYELDELLSINDVRATFEGTDELKAH